MKDKKPDVKDETVSAKTGSAESGKVGIDELRASELRYRRLFETAEDGILILDAETGMINDVNPFLIKLLGYPYEYFIGKSIWELGFFKDIIANKDKFKELQNKEYIRYEDMPLETAGGQKIEVEFVSNVYLVNHHRVIQCNIRDVSERKRTEALRESEERYRTLFLCISDGIIIHDTNGVVVDANEVTCVRLGYERDEILGMNVKEIVDNESSLKVNKRISDTMQVGETLFETVYLTKSGKKIFCEVSERIFEIKGERLIQSISRDITERKQVQEALVVSERLLRNLSRKLISAHEEERTVLAREIHDELGQELSALLLEIEWLKKQPEHKQEFFQRLSGMVEELSFEVWRICKGLHPVVLDKLGLSAAMESYLEIFEKREKLAVKSNIATVTKNELPRDVALGIYRIFQESLTNTLKHSNAECVVVSMIHTDDELVLEMRDDGVGFPLKKNNGDEKGIGLIGMRERAALMNGALNIQSLPGQGTCITLRVPINKNAGETS